MASAKGEPKQAPSPSAKAKPKAKPKSVAGGMGKPKQAKAKNAKQKPSRPKKQSLRKRNEELRAELRGLYSDAVLVAYERTALGTATDADERENIIRVAEEAATKRTTSERMYREKAENDRDTVLAEAEAVMKKEVQRRDEEDERRSAAEAEMRRAAEEEIRMRLAEDKRRGEAQAAERKLAADEARARAEAEAAARAAAADADRKSAETARIKANEDSRRAATDASALAAAEAEKKRRAEEDRRRADAERAIADAIAAEARTIAEEDRRRADARNAALRAAEDERARIEAEDARRAAAAEVYEEALRALHAKDGVAPRRANAAAALKAAWDVEKVARESVANTEAAAERKDTFDDATRAEASRRAEEDARRERFDVEDRRRTASEELRRAQFDKDLPRLSGLDEEAASTRAAEEARRCDFDAAKLTMEDDERRAREAEETRVAEATDNLINLERAVDNAASTTSTRRESWEHRLSEPEKARRAKADVAMRIQIGVEVVRRREEDRDFSLAENYLRLMAAEAARLPDAESAIRTCTEHTVAAETNLFHAAAQRDVGGTSTPAPVTPAPTLTTTLTMGTCAPTPTPTPTPTFGASTPAPKSASTPASGTPAPTPEPVLDHQQERIRRLAKKLLDGPLEKLNMPGSKTPVEGHVVESIIATSFARFESSFAEAIFESHEGSEWSDNPLETLDEPLETLGGRLRLVGAAADRAFEAFTMHTFGVYYFEAEIDKGEDIKFGPGYPHFRSHLNRSRLKANARTFAKYTGKVNAVTAFERALQHLGVSVSGKSGTAVWQDLLGDLKEDLKNGKTERLALTLLMDHFDIVALAKKFRISWKDTCTLSETVLMATVRSVSSDEFGGLGANIANGVNSGRAGRRTGPSGLSRKTVKLMKEVTDVLSELKGTPDEEDGIATSKIAERCGDDVDCFRVVYVLNLDRGDDGAFFETTGSKPAGRKWRLRRDGEVSAALNSSKTRDEVNEKVSGVLSKLKGTTNEEDGIAASEIAEQCGDDFTVEHVRRLLQSECGDGGAFFETTGLSKRRRWRLRRDGEVNAARKTGTKRKRSEDGRGDDASAASGKQKRKL